VTKSSVGFFERNAPGTSERGLIRVLHVDDDACFLQCAKQCLEMQGQFQVETVLSVDEALGKLRNEEYDVVVCDYQMPKRDGLQYFLELRRKGISVPFILFTGKGREEVAVKALNLGIDGYFNKNGHPETVYGELAHGIKQTVEKRRAYARTRALMKTTIELASLSSDVIVQEFLMKRLMEMTGAIAVSFADYDPSSQTLMVRLVEVEPKKQEKFARLLGKRSGDIRCPVSEEDYREITHNVIGKRQTLTEATYGGIPPTIGAEIQKLLGVDRFIGVAYIVEGELFGTSLLAMKAGMPDPQQEMIESFAHIAAVSLRRCQAEVAMKKSEEKYRQLVENTHEGLEKLETLNQKLHTVGSLTRHDVKNKLSSVVNNAYLIRKTLPNDRKALAYLEGIESACEQATRIFDFAAMYEKLGCEKLKVMDVGKSIGEAVSLFPNLKGVEVVNECYGLKVMADSLLNQVFYNMVDNSLKYGIKVSQIRIYSEEKEKELKLFYEDDGVGIPAANKPKLFDVGFTTGKGSGYGLPLIKKMMEIYGWTIEEEGKAGMGAKFIMRIPKKKSETEDLRARTQKDSQRQLKV